MATEATKGYSGCHQQLWYDQKSPGGIFKHTDHKYFVLCLLKSE